MFLICCFMQFTATGWFEMHFVIEYYDILGIDNNEDNNNFLYNHVFYFHWSWIFFAMKWKMMNSFIGKSVSFLCCKRTLNEKSTLQCSSMESANDESPEKQTSSRLFICVIFFFFLDVKITVLVPFSCTLSPTFHVPEFVRLITSYKNAANASHFIVMIIVWKCWFSVAFHLFLMLENLLLRSWCQNVFRDVR